MTVEVIKIVTSRPGLLEWGQNEFYALPGWGKFGLIAAAPAAAVVAIAVGVEAAAIAGGALLIAGLAGAVSEPQNVTERQQTLDEVASITDHDGNQLTVGQRYIRHPRRSNVFLSTDNYHHDIVREQQRQLISYIRSELAVTRLQIAISYDGAEEVGIRSPLFGLGRKENLSGSILCDLTYATPALVAPTEDLFWLDHFSNVRAGLQHGGGGRKRFVEKFGKNVNCNAQIAEKYGFKSEACKSYSLTMLIET